MRLFICWSGKRGHGLANATRDLLRGVFSLSPDDVFVSSETEKGVNWFDEILQNLERADAGILCLTPEGMRSPWIHFEAGSLAMGMAMGRQRAGGAHPQGRLYTLLHQVTPGEMDGPLASYQSTTTEQGDVARLMISLAELAGMETCPREPLREHWAAFETALRGLELSVPDVVPEFEAMFRRKTFHEPVHQCASQKWVDRYLGARDTRVKLSGYADVVRNACGPSARELFGQLQSELDGYAMAMEALLIQPRKFEMRETGELALEPGTRRTCEQRRLKVNTLACRLRDHDAPLCDHAVLYAGAETHAERRRIIHVLESRVRQHCERARGGGAARDPSRDLLGGRSRAEHAASTWDLDRILRYLVLKYFPDARGEAPGACAGQAARDALLELEALRTSAGSMLPLYHALGALQAALRQPAADAGEVDAVLREIGEYLDEGGRRRDRGGMVERSVKSIRARLAARAPAHPADGAAALQVVAV